MALIITIKIVPNAGKVAWILDKQHRIKLFVKSPPEKGRANQEVRKIIALALGLPQMAIEIIKGATSPLKLIKIHSATSMEDFLRAVGIPRQNSLLD